MCKKFFLFISFYIQTNRIQELQFLDVFNNTGMDSYFKFCYVAAAAKSLQSCPTLCDPIDGSPPGSSVPGIFQARTLEWVVISFPNACMQSCFSRV